MSTKLLDRIVDLAHYRQIQNVADLRNQVTWGFLDSLAPRIIDLVQKFCPPPVVTLFTREPLQRAPQSAASASVPAVVKGQRKCKECGVTGHYRECILILELSLYV